MIFLTVGTYPLPFERLVKAVDAAIAKGFFEEEVFAQIGPCKYKPRNMRYVEMLEKDAFDCHFRKATSIISHAGIGTIKMALDNEKALLAMPRLKEYREVVNNHQIATATKFERLGHILVAYDPADLPSCLHKLKHFVPKKRKGDPDKVAERICRFLNSLRG